MRIRPLLERMLQPDPANRPATMAEIVNWQVGSSQQRSFDPLARAEPPEFRPERHMLPKRNRRPLWLVVAAAILVTMVGEGVYAFYTLVWSEPDTVRPPPLPEFGQKSQAALPEPKASPALTAQQPLVPASSAGDAAARTDHVRRYVEQYNGGDCFFMLPVALSSNAAVIEGFGASTAPFEALEKAFRRELGFEASSGRALVDAHAVLIMIRDGQELVVAASAGYASDARGSRLPIADSTWGRVLLRGRPERIGDAAARLLVAPSELGVADARNALLVPMLHRGAGVGVLAAFDRGDDAAAFSDADEHLLHTFAASAANAVAIARSVQADRLRSSIAAAEAERARWARKLHDETLQILGGLRVLLSGTLRQADPSRSEAAIREAVQETERGIEGLRAIVSELRPGAPE